MLHVTGMYGSWDIDTDAKRIHYNGVRDQAAFDALPKVLRAWVTDAGVGLCEAERQGDDGWAPYAELERCEVGKGMFVRWLDDTVMRVPGFVVTAVEEVT